MLYAALAPSSQCSDILKSACRTWEDHLWASISVICEEKQSAEMFALGGGFWEGGLATVERGLNPEPDDNMDEEWERTVDDSLDSLKSIQVQEG
jgi:nuclear pore complex protein Nup107